MSNKGLILRGEFDVDGLDGKLKFSGRYWFVKYLVMERYRNFRRIRIIVLKKYVRVLFDDFILLLDEDGNDNLFLGVFIVEESWEDEVLRKIREFNKMIRE